MAGWGEVLVVAAQVLAAEGRVGGSEVTEVVEGLMEPEARAAVEVMVDEGTATVGGARAAA